MTHIVHGPHCGRDELQGQDQEDAHTIHDVGQGHEEHNAHQHTEQVDVVRVVAGVLNSQNTRKGYENGQEVGRKSETGASCWVKRSGILRRLNAQCNDISHTPHHSLGTCSARTFKVRHGSTCVQVRGCSCKCVRVRGVESLGHSHFESRKGCE